MNIIGSAVPPHIAMANSFFIAVFCWLLLFSLGALVRNIDTCFTGGDSRGRPAHPIDHEGAGCDIQQDDGGRRVDGLLRFEH